MVIPFSASASIEGINKTGQDDEEKARDAILAAAKTSDSKGAWGVIMTYNDVGVNCYGRPHEQEQPPRTR